MNSANRTSMTLRLLVAVVVLALGGAVTANAAEAPALLPAAAVGTVVDTSETAIGTVEQDGPFPGDWWRCDVVGWWVVDADGNLGIRGQAICEQGFAQGDTNIHVAASAGDDCNFHAPVGNVDHGGTTIVQLSWDADPGATCGPIAEICWRDFEEGVDTWPGEITRGEIEDLDCASWGLDAPPEPEDPWYTGETGCSIWSPLEPWVSDYQPVTVTGGWAWQSEATVRVPEYPPGALTLDSYTPIPHLIASVTPVTGQIVETNDADGAVSEIRNSSGNGWISANFKVGSGSANTRAQRSIKVTGAVHTGTPGSVALDWEWRGVGLMWASGSTFGQTISATDTPGSHSSRPSTATINGDFGLYGGHHDPERCHFWWGTDVFPSDTSGYDTPAGPLTLRESGTPPAPGGSGGAGPVPPDIVVGPDGPEDPECPSGAVCIPEPTSPEEDENGDSCGDGFSLTNPLTWVAAGLCGVVQAIMALAEVVGAVLKAIVGVIAAIGDLLLSLFIPDPDVFADAIASLQDTITSGPIGDWLAAFTPPGGGGEGMMMGFSEGGGGGMMSASATSSCEGPAIDFGDLGLPSGTLPTDPVHPFDACEGTTATVAENVRKWTGIGIMIGSGFKIIEMIMGSFGAMRQVRIMSSHDWTGPGSGRF